MSHGLVFLRFYVFVAQKLPLLPDKLIYLCGQRRHPVYALLPGHAGGVGTVGELVGVVAEARHLAQQIGVVGTGAWMNFCAHDQCAQIFLAGKAA